MKSHDFLINPGNKDISWKSMKSHGFLINPGKEDICEKVKTQEKFRKAVRLSQYINKKQAVISCKSMNLYRDRSNKQKCWEFMKFHEIV